MGEGAQMVASWLPLPFWGGFSLRQASISGAFEESTVPGYSLETPVITFPSVVSATVQAHSHCSEPIAMTLVLSDTHIPGLQRAGRRTILWRKASVSITRRQNSSWVSKNNRCSSQNNSNNSHQHPLPPVKSSCQPALKLPLVTPHEPLSCLWEAKPCLGRSLLL